MSGGRVGHVWVVVVALALAVGLLVAVGPAQAETYGRPVFVSPASGTVVGERLTVTARSEAPYVAFALSPTSIYRKVVPVTGGRATATFSTLGFDGRMRVFASSCGTPTRDCGNPTTHYVRAMNPEPTIEQPTADEVLYPTEDIIVRVRLEAGSVKLYAGGLASAAVDTERPFRFVLDKDRVPQGSRSISAVACSSSGEKCSGAEDQVTVQIHRPAMSVWPENVAVSPNGDGVADSRPLKFAFEERSQLTLGVWKNQTLVRTVDLGEFGYRERHRVQVPDALGVLSEGRYSVRFVASLVANPEVTETQTVNLSVDLSAPQVKDKQLPHRTIYPHPDGYQDGVQASIRVDEPLREVGVEVRNDAGDLVRRLSPFRKQDSRDYTYAAGWSGLAGGERVPVGEYQIRWIFEDATGNASTTTQRLAVDDDVLVKRDVSLNVKASDAVDWEVGRCSAVRKDPRSAGGRLLLSDEKCNSSPYDNRRHVVAAYYSVALPKSVLPQRANVSMVGGAVRKGSHLGTIFWMADKDKWSDVEWSGPGTKRYRLLRAGSSEVDKMLWRGRLVWASFVNRGMQYRIRDFRIETTRAFLAEPARPAPLL